MLKSLRHRPVLYNVLLGLFAIVALQLIYVFISSFYFAPNILRAALQLVLWIGLFSGFYFLRKWAWAGFFVLVLFSLFHLIYALIPRGISIQWFQFMPVVIAVFILWALVHSSILSLFKIEKQNHQDKPVSVFIFALLCLTVSLFLIVELFSFNRLAVFSLPGKLFIGSMAFVFLLLSIGLMRLKKIAVQATHSILIFAFLITAFMLLYDLYQNRRSMALPNLIFYLSISGFMLLYWVRFALPKAKRE